ncbi:MAG: hypothetical protein EBS23_06080 [Betaproteobacteria bacterium]|nr:hypothetical protein [Betaproteobacteria bacterium]
MNLSIRSLMRRSRSVAGKWLGAALGVLVLASAVTAAVPTRAVMPHLSAHKTEGTVNCASSTCHGSIVPWDGSNVLQNEYTTWVRMDKHTRAYRVLLNDESKRIAKNLGLEEGAHKAKICLDCHAHNPSGPRGERFIQSEGIGCEGCHGPSGKWIGEHTVDGRTHAENIADGLYPTANPTAQARLCLSCHFGDDSRFVTHRIMGAGHPRISFEIKTFTALEPAHWKVDADYVQRKGSYDPLRIWAIGQAIAAQQILDVVSDPKRRDGLFPELVAFDCHACHHPMSDKRWNARLGTGPGVVRVNDSSLLMVRAIVRATDPSASAGFDAQVRAMHLAVSTGKKPAGKTEVDMVRELSATIGGMLPALERQSFAPATMRKVLLALIDESRESSYSDYAGAEQAYMAITNVANDLLQSGTLVMSDDLRRNMTDLLKALANDEKYKPDVFANRLLTLRNVVALQAR